MSVVKCGPGQTVAPSRSGRWARAVGVLSGAVAVALVLAACGGGGSTASSAPQSTAAPDPGDVQPSAVAVAIDPGQFLNIDTVCPGVTDGTSQLTVSFDLVNFGANDVDITKITPLLPFGGLKQTGPTTSGGNCLNPGSDSQYLLLRAGARTLFTMTFRLLKPCPSDSQVQAIVHVLAGTQRATTTVPIFTNLKTVPFAHCTP